MTSYRVQVLNHSGHAASYFLACPKPKVTGLSTDATVWATVLASKTDVQANDVAMVVAPAGAYSTYIICGSSPNNALATGLVLDFSEASQLIPVSADSTGMAPPSPRFHVLCQNGQLGFNTPPMTVNGSVSNWCTVDTMNYPFSAGCKSSSTLKIVDLTGASVNAFAGLAVTDNILPTCVWPISPGASYSIASQPPPMFVLGAGSYEEGALVSLGSDIGPLAAIDFSTASGHLCHVTHDSNGLINAKPPVR